MHILILMLLLASLTACKSENKILGRPFVAPAEEKKEEKGETREQLQISTKPYQIVSFEKNKSVLRDKLMSVFIKNHLDKKLLKTTSVSISVEEEYKLKGNVFTLTNVEQADYVLKSKEQARVVIAYSDHVMVFIVPVGTDLNNIEEKLAIKEEPNKSLLVIGKKEGIATAGQVVYFLSANRQEIIDYDLQTYSENSYYGTFSENLNLKLQKTQKHEAVVTYEYFTQTLIDQEFSTPAKCSTNNNNICPCVWTRKVPGNSMFKSNPGAIEDLGLVVKINNTITNFKEISAIVNSSNEISLKLHSSEQNDQSHYDVSISFVSPDFTYNSIVDLNLRGKYCTYVPINVFKSAIETVKAKTQASLKLITYGHGDLLNDMTL